MENMDTGFAEFAAAFGDDSYQSDTVEETAETEPTEETASDGGEEATEETQDAPESAETADEVTDGEAEEDGAEGAPEDDGGTPEQKFTIKVNKEEREVDLQEMTELAQKGADYDRVKGQLETERQNTQTLQAELDKQKPLMEILELAAEQGGMSIEQLLENVHIGLLKGKGMSDAEAKAEIRAARAEKQVKTMTEQQTQKQATEDEQAQRAQREIAEFARNFPDVPLSEELVGKLASDVQAGMSLTAAYLKMENTRLREEAAQREAQQKMQQEAAAQNKRNRARAPGSQRDSGGQQTKSDFDDFAKAFR